MFGARGASKRRLHWLSSESGDPELQRLHTQLAAYYRDPRVRGAYQEVLDGHDPSAPEGVVQAELLGHLAALRPARILEVGCGSGRLFEQLGVRGWAGSYTGIDLPLDLLSETRRKHLEGGWVSAEVYALPFAEHAFEVVFCLYVLEHLVFPRRGLDEMLRVVRPGGRLVLAFPDFSVSGILPSQWLGLSTLGSAREKLRAGRVVDALVSLYDSRVRVRPALRRAARRFGPFPVNARPVCLSASAPVGADLDAVYLASRTEVEQWAEGHGCAVENPAGCTGEFSTQVLLSLRRPPLPRA